MLAQDVPYCYSYAGLTYGFALASLLHEVVEETGPPDMIGTNEERQVVCV